MCIESVIDVARGKAPADILLKDALVVNVFTGEILKQSVAVKDGVVAGVGYYDRGEETFDLAGRYLIPGLIDAHIHIESSMLTPAAFAAEVVPHGVTTVVADPHEIVNVAGLAGLDYMIKASSGLPLDIFYMMPSCVPATNLETAGASVSKVEIDSFFKKHPRSPGLAEMMNYPGVCLKDQAVLGKIRAARESRLVIDGHAPQLSGRDLNAYISTGITSEHESVSAAEALEKLRLGMKIIMREGSAARNLISILPIVTEKNCPNILFGCDDRSPADLVNEGEIDFVLRKAVSYGLDPVMAVQMATINPARHYNLPGLGAVAPGYRADLVVLPNLADFQAEMVFKEGVLVARDNKLLAGLPAPEDKSVRNTVCLPELRGRFELDVPAGKNLARVIEVLPDQILTRCVFVRPAELTAAHDIARVAVVERHGKNGNVAVGLVRGFRLENGAIASTVAHDSHNLIIVGQSAGDMELAARTIAATGGGLAAVSGGKVLAALPLPLAGLISDQDARNVAAQHAELHKAAKKLGCTLPSPFMTMSFLALPVIPELRITDMGLVDANHFQLVDLWVRE
ncbi:adenine deaminase [Pelotomaculum propionicicum]|uniref:Adenine deaminase n=1 Tax=Pelotomaculum propionicicum TaxID=258475 RepID=A0A4Y7RSD8_9FIRM|nr:adenine deaminase [Pelotomaculum propionicicum]NLI13034.1 adenine deaminase [Peptococcaceae bacterium]TEB11918.1 Adenine deaminase [Pelotomaculum propionicicum]